MPRDNLSSFRHNIKSKIPENQIISDNLRLLVFGTDASFYRLIPKLAVMVRNKEETAQLIKEAGIWDDLSQLDTAALNRILKSDDLDSGLRQKIMDLVTIEESQAIYPSKLKEQEK